MPWHKDIGSVAQTLGAVPPADSGAIITGVSTDTRTLQPGDLFVALKGPNFDGSEFVAPAFERGAAAAISTQPSDAGPTIVVEDTLAALQAIAAAHRNAHDARVIAITGSCGKTSVKDYISALLETRYNVISTQGNLNNEIGCPLTLLRIDDDTDIAIVEMGANHKGEIARLCELARPDESLITMIAPAHLEGFGSIDDVAEAKGEIAAGLNEGGVFYANLDDQRCKKIASQHSGEVVGIGEGGAVYLRNCAPAGDGDGLILDIVPVGTLQLPLATPALATNVLISVATGLRHGIEDFEGPLRAVMQSRGRIKRTIVGPYTVLDDSYNANPASMRAAIDALSRLAQAPKIAALGEMLELGSDAARYHRELGKQAGAAGISILIAKGPNANETIEGARTSGVEFAEAIEDHAEIARAIREHAADGGSVLVKGSRGMRMEGVIEALRSQLGITECCTS